MFVYVYDIFRGGEIEYLNGPDSYAGWSLYSW